MFTKMARNCTCNSWKWLKKKHHQLYRDYNPLTRTSQTHNVQLKEKRSKSWLLETLRRKHKYAHTQTHKPSFSKKQHVLLGSLALSQQCPHMFKTQNKPKKRKDDKCRPARTGFHGNNQQTEAMWDLGNSRNVYPIWETDSGLKPSQSCNTTSILATSTHSLSHTYKIFQNSSFPQPGKSTDDTHTQTHTQGQEYERSKKDQGNKRREEERKEGKRGD